MSLFTKNSQTHFYRYLDSFGAIKTLESRTLRLTAPGNLNDPEDLIFEKFIPFSHEELMIELALMSAKSLSEGKVPKLLLQHYPSPLNPSINPFNSSRVHQFLKEFLLSDDFHSSYKSTFDGIHRKLNETFRDAFDNHFLLCLTTDHKNPKMWDVYGEGNKGVVLEFKCCLERDNVFLAAMKVNYSPTPPSFGTKAEWISLMSGNKGIDHEQFYRNALTWKGTDWSYEDEWRLVWIDPTSKGQKHTFLPLHPRDISRIFLGANIETATRATILNITRDYYPYTEVIQQT